MQYHILLDGKKIPVELLDTFEMGGHFYCSVKTVDGSEPFMILGRDYKMLNGARRWMPCSFTTLPILDIHYIPDFVHTNIVTIPQPVVIEMAA